MAEVVSGRPLSPDALVVLGAGDFRFDTTAEVEPLVDWPGQERALEALRLAAAMPHADYNLFVLGTPGSGRRSAARTVLAEAARARPVPRDWVHVANFDDPRRPAAIDLPAGQAIRLRDGVRKVINDLATDIPAIFESEDYQTRRRAIEEAHEDRNEKAMSALAHRAHDRGVAIVRTPVGFGVAARRGDEILQPEAYRQLPEAERRVIDAAVAEIRAELEAILKEVPKSLKAQRKEVEELNISMAREGVDAGMAELIAAFGGQEGALRHLAAMRQDLIDNADTAEIDPITLGAIEKHYAQK